MLQSHHLTAAFALLLIATTSLGCGKDDDKSAGDTKARAEVETETEAKTPPAKKSGLELFTGSAVAFPEPIAKLRYFMPVDEAAKLTPALVGKDEQYGPLEGYKKAQVIISLTKGDTHLRAFVFTIENTLDELTAHLTKLWAAPVELTTSSGNLQRYWTNSKAGLRMWAESSGGGSRIVFERVMAFDDFLGSEKGRFGFERLPLLGATEEDVRKAYADELIGAAKTEGKISILMPMPDVSAYPHFITLTLDKGKVKQWQFSMSYSFDETGKDKMLAALKQKFGKAKKGRMYIDYKGPPKVKTNLDATVIWVK